MQTKKEIILDFINQGNYPKALSIAKTFVRDFDKEEQRIIQIAHECVNGSGKSMYKMLGINIEETINQAKQLLNDFKVRAETKTLNYIIEPISSCGIIENEITILKSGEIKSKGKK